MLKRFFDSFEKWKQRKIDFIELDSIEEREVVLEKARYHNNKMIVTYISLGHILNFKIYHFPKGRSILKAVDHGEFITIGDIECVKNNKGYGSIMLEELIEYAKEKEKEYIDGWLSQSDVKDHKERLLAFYKKFGFEITDDYSSNSNRLYNIELKL